MYICGNFIYYFGGYNPQKIICDLRLRGLLEGPGSLECVSSEVDADCMQSSGLVYKCVLLLFCYFFFPLTPSQPDFCEAVLWMVTVRVKHLVVISVHFQFSSLCG